MAKADPLKPYREMRNFRRTPEPRGHARRARRKPIFVIQQHDATASHFDFRLEVGGVLKSWAVPKGPSTNPKDKRLAMATEDHPLEYAEFEGGIPEGEYGAGPMIVWDQGKYENLTRRDGKPVSIEQALEDGHLEDGHLIVGLDGEKLAGAYVLNRMAGRAPNKWLLVKKKDEGADARRNPIKSQPEIKIARHMPTGSLARASLNNVARSSMSWSTNLRHLHIWPIRHASRSTRSCRVLIDWTHRICSCSNSIRLAMTSTSPGILRSTYTRCSKMNCSYRLS